jgi:cytochrome P450
MIELIKDPSLFRAKVLEAIIVDTVTWKHNFDIQKLLALPILQSVYTESLRLHVSINITRELLQPMVLDGFKLSQGAILQTSTKPSHYDETIWAKEGHPASEFWAERHVKTV